jgi:hypothetical protein
VSCRAARLVAASPDTPRPAATAATFPRRLSRETGRYGERMPTPRRQIGLVVKLDGRKVDSETTALWAGRMCSP